MDTPLTLDHAINMAGLIQATAHWLLTERPFKPQEQDYLLYKFNRFQACRYGLEGVLTDAYTGDRADAITVSAFSSLIFLPITRYPADTKGY